MATKMNPLRVPTHPRLTSGDPFVSMTACRDGRLSAKSSRSANADIG